MSSNLDPADAMPAQRVALKSEEVVIRAIVEDEWTEERGCSPSIFQRPNTSVTRITPISLEQGIAIVKRDIEKPGCPGRNLRATGMISVETIKKVGLSPVPGPSPGPCLHMEVWEDPVPATQDKPGNPYHAEINAFDHAAMANPRKKISLGYSRMLSKALHLYKLDPAGVITDEIPPQDWSNSDE